MRAGLGVGGLGAGGRLDGTVVAAVHGDLSAGGFGKRWTGHAGDHQADVSAGDLAFHQIAFFVLFDGQAVAFGAALEGFGGPEFGIEDGVGVDDIDADVMGGEFQCGHAGELSDAGFGARVAGGAGAGSAHIAATDEDGGGVDSFFQEWDAMFEKLFVAGEVEQQRAGPVGVVEVLDVGPGGEDAGVTDEDVQSAEPAHGFDDGIFDGLLIGQVDDESELIGSLKGGDDIGIDVEGDDGGALFVEHFADGEADAGGGTGDEGDFPLEGGFGTGLLS